MSHVATRHALSEQDRTFARQVVDHTRRSTGATLSFRSKGGEGTSVELPAQVLQALTDMLSRLADNGEVLIVNQEAELSPEEASKVLNISRPMVYKRMDDGVLSFRPVGRHRKVLLKDVMALKASEERKRSAARELAEDAVDLELNYADPQSAP